MDTLGYLLATMIGLTSGMIGGGGFILTIPVLVYAMLLNLIRSYLLFVVGTKSLAGAISYFRKRLLHFRAAIAFFIPTFIAVIIIRSYLMPDLLFGVIVFEVGKQLFMMVVFALLMIISSYSMISPLSLKDKGSVPGNINFNYPLILIVGVLVGAITGFVGAGGGFLIISALMLLVGFPMKVAAGTSLLLIAAKSLIGFSGDVYSSLHVDWGILSLITAFALTGISIGIYLSESANIEKINTRFWLVYTGIRNPDNIKRIDLTNPILLI